MKEQIEIKIAEWTQGLEELQTQRAKLARQLSEIDAAIQRNAGAISGAKEFLVLLEDANAQPVTQAQ